MINFDIIKSHSDPDFVARTYAEYLQTRANEYVELINIVSEATVRDAAVLLDEVEDSFTVTMSGISERILEICEEQEINLSELDSNSQEYQEAVLNAVSDSSLDQVFEDNFLDPDYVRAHYLEYTVPNITVGRSVVIPDSSALTEVTMDDLRNRYKMYRETCEDIAEDICTEHDLRFDMPITLESGYTNAKDLLTAVISNVNSTASDNSSLTLQLTSTEGAVTCAKDSLANYSLTSLSDELKRTLASAVSYAGGFLASTKETVSDRLQLFESYVSGKFKDITDYASTQVTAIKDVLNNAKNTSIDFFNNFLKMTGWKEESGSVSIPETVDKSDMSNYTGASLVGALDWSNAKRIGSNVAKTIGVATASIAVAAYKVVKGFFSKVGKWFVRNVVEGSDLKDLGNESSSGLIDGFQYQGKGDASDSRIDLDLLSTTKMTFYFKTKYKAAVAKSIIEKKLNKWVSFSLLYGMFMIRPLSVFQVSTTGQTPDGIYLVVNFHWVYKPISISDDKLSEAANLAAQSYPGLIINGTAAHPNDRYLYFNPNSPDSIAELGLMLQQLGDIKTTTDQLDAPRVKGYALSAILSQAVSSAALSNVDSQITNDLWTQGYPKSPSVNSTFVTCAYNVDNTAGATNVDFIKAAAGYMDNGVEVRWDVIPIDHVGNDYFDDTRTYINMDIHGLFYSLVVCWLDQYYDPQHFGYLAYSNDETNFPEPQFQVVTDAENISIINNAITTGIIVAVVAVLAIITMIKFKNWKKKRFMTMTAAVGEMDNAMWQGDGLSKKDCKKYIRLQRKLNKSNMLTKGLCGSDSSSDNLLSRIEGVASRVDTIYCQATGQSASALSPYLPARNITAENSFADINGVIQQSNTDINSNTDQNIAGLRALIVSE